MGMYKHIVLIQIGVHIVLIQIGVQRKWRILVDDSSMSPVEHFKGEEGHYWDEEQTVNSGCVFLNFSFSFQWRIYFPLVTVTEAFRKLNIVEFFSPFFFFGVCVSALAICLYLSKLET